MTVSYLKGNESPTADLMNDLFAALDGKMTQILGGRSFFLAQINNMPGYLCGKAFFFTAGLPIYAPRVPGYIPVTTNGVTVARPYNHQQFISALTVQSTPQVQTFLTGVTIIDGGHGYNPNDILTVVGGDGQAATVQVVLSITGPGSIDSIVVLSIGNYTTQPPSPNMPTGGSGTGAILALTFSDSAFDEVNKVVTIPRIGPSNYQGLPENDFVGFFEWSLAAHYLMHQGKTDKAPTKYYIQEKNSTLNGSVQLPPEKHLKYAVAEIIIEGVQNVNIDATWDKYSCFRIHNLNPYPATITFGGTNSYSLMLSPFACRSVRRDLTNGSYSQDYNYFFKFQPNDPRFYWFFPTSSGWLYTGVINSMGDDGRAANSMQANNLVHPAILLDWIQFFTRDVGGEIWPYSDTAFAGFNQDPSVQCDVSTFYKNLFGDPSNPATVVGDLLHHRGDILIARASRTKTDPLTGKPVLTFDKMTFSGYATIVADFAAKKMTVAENSAGNLVISGNDPENDIYLIPIGTNLFKQGEAIPTKIDLSGTKTFAIENAIFEDQTGVEPGGTFYGSGNSLSLSSGAPQLIQQPIATTTVPQQTYIDIYDLQSGPTVPPGVSTYWGEDGIYYYFVPKIVNGTPQTTLNWNTTARGLVLVPTILDGGSGYEVGDIEQLAGGSGNPAIVTITGTDGGRVTAIALSYGGNYSTPPNNPNLPIPIYPTDRSGVGLVLGGISIPIKTINGIHKVTVADLLRLDWWGDPHFGDQNSDYVSIENRKLTLTPQGLVLTFTETDSPLPGDLTGQPLTLPTWASGKRGLPRNRAIGFRGHGWGYQSAVQGSNSSGFLSPRAQRQQSSQDFTGEIIAPNGQDFSVLPLNSQQTKTSVLTRIKNSWLSLVNNIAYPSASRFWKAFGTGDGLDTFLRAQKAFNAEEFNLLFFESFSTLSNSRPYCMVLLPEMYNALAQAVNACTSGVPLQWQCLFFNVNGNIVSLNPAGQSDVIGFSNSSNCSAYTTPVPINQFASFPDQSLFHQLCDQLKIPVKTDADLPGGAEGPFSFYQQQFSLPAIYYTYVTAQSNGDTGCTPADPGVPPSDPSGNGVDRFSGTLTVNIETEMLSAAAIANGQATGSRCLGTYDPTVYPGPDMTDAPDGGFYIANDGSGNIIYKQSSGVSSANAFHFWVYDKSSFPAGLADCTVSGQDIAIGPFGTGIYLNQAYVDYRWIQIEDVKALVESYGFNFFWNEICTPLELRYFEKPTQQAMLAAQNPATVPWTATAFGSAHYNALNVRAGDGMFGTVYSQVGPPGWEEAELAQINSLFASEVAIGNAMVFTVNSCLFGNFDSYIKFCPTADSSKARWKVAPVSSLQWSDDGPDNGCPTEICNIQSRSGLSPLFRYVGVTASVGLVGFNYTWQVPTWSPGIGFGTPVFQTGQRPSSVSCAQIVPQYTLSDNELIRCNYNPGNIWDQYEVFAFNIYSSQPIAPISISLSGVASWEMQKDWWGTLDTAYASLYPLGGGFGVVNGNSYSMPWSFVPPAHSYTMEVSNNGLTILSAGQDQRYWCCFDMGAAGITLT
ncbi:MAG TPA: hypothetical protein VGY56_17405 [Verrucomicrobiae bacterium]|nr:hypothetical protein [Verrucomicrobiae bacterium]